MQHDFYGIIFTVVSKLWKTRSGRVIQQTTISSGFQASGNGNETTQNTRHSIKETHAMALCHCDAVLLISGFFVLHCNFVDVFLLKIPFFLKTNFVFTFLNFAVTQ